jgi:lactate dehydrogenase-like 2-hydroxyacid dehydrogenase
MRACRAAEQLLTGVPVKLAPRVDEVVAALLTGADAFDVEAARKLIQAALVQQYCRIIVAQPVVAPHLEGTEHAPVFACIQD